MTDSFPNDSKIPHLSDEEEKELFSDYASIVLAASKPFDKEDERLLDNPLKFDLGDEDKTFEGELPPSLEEVEKRLKVDKLDFAQGQFKRNGGVCPSTYPACIS